MNLSLPKKITFWAALVIAVVSIIVYILHVLTQVDYSGVTSSVSIIE
jgi:hypothetical protein